MAFPISVTPSCMPKTAAPVLRRAVRCCSAASISSKFELRNYWTSLITEVDQKLNDAVPLKYPELIHEAMRYSLLPDTAKRAPAVLCVAVCDLFGGDRAAVFPTACALEMVHVASLIHNDLPYIDDSLSRGGQPSNHTLYGADMAILAGDALLSRAFQHIVLHTPTQLVTHPQLLRVVREIARAAGSAGMAAAQYLDEPSREKKLGELGQCSAVCGGLLAGAAADEIARLSEYGRIVGILYRVVEVILQARTDASVYGVEKGVRVVEELKSRAKKELHVFEKYGQNVLPLYHFIDYTAERATMI